MKAGSLALLLTLSASTTARAETRFALLVGHNIGHPNEVALRWAEEDARRMQELLVAVGKVDVERAILLRGPTPGDVHEALAGLQVMVDAAKRRQERIVVFFYYSGHADDSALHLGLQTLSISALNARLSGLGADTVVEILDACRNDRTPRATAKGATRAPAFEWPAAHAASPRGFVQLRSASKGEVAQESDDLQGSLFSHHVLSGLRGSADSDRDGVVTLGELHRYGYRRTLESSHRQAAAVQHSELKVDLYGQSELIVTYPREADVRMIFGAEISGHVLIVDDASGRIVAELYSDTGTERELAVPRGRYRVQVRRQGTFRSGLVRADGGSRRVRLAELRPQEALAVMTKGAAFDPHPWEISAAGGVGRAAVAGFDPVPFASIGVTWRWHPRFHLAVRGFVGYQQADGSPWQLEQFEWGAGAGVDWSFLRAARWDGRVGLRVGVVGVVQAGERADADRLRAVGIESVAVEDSNAGWGPDLAAVLTIDFFPWTQLGFRLAGSPSVRWLRVDGDMTARWGFSGEAGAVIRL